VLRGEHSSLLSQKTVAKMAEHHPNMRHVDIAGQGHAPMLHTASIPPTIAEFLVGIKG
jgi:pimeloyl-ACP methyl ester carboxylesterase